MRALKINIFHLIYNIPKYNYCAMLPICEIYERLKVTFLVSNLVFKKIVEWIHM